MKYFVIAAFLINFLPQQTTPQNKTIEKFSPNLTQHLKVPSAKPLNFQEFHHRNIQRKILERSA